MKRLNLQKSLPSSCYISSEIYEREKNLIFCREWFCAGREEELPTPGCFLVLDVLGESILVVRTKRGELRAHYNVCRHRGARLCVGADYKQDNRVRLGGGVTTSRVIRCPYHSWTYSLEGKLLGAPHLRLTDAFSAEEFSLYPVGIESWGGFFFLNLAPADAVAQGRNLKSQHVLLSAQFLVRYPLVELRTARRLVYDVDANWKIIAENYNECYHCGPVHPELCEIVPAFKQHGGANLDWEKGIPHRKGAFTFTRTGTSVRPPFRSLNDEEKVRHKGELMYPNLMLSLSSDHVAAFILWPDGPRRTKVSCDFLFDPAEMSRSDFDPSDAVEFWDLINRQDWAICERVQLGIQSRVHRFGYYAPMENDSMNMRSYICERLRIVQELDEASAIRRQDS
jgi:Rieske 2Fe-2S family protein